eukprot:IDg22613t1
MDHETLASAVSWKSKKQTVVATSSCEAEYIASCSIAKEAIWLSRLLAEIENNSIVPETAILMDNQGAISSSKNLSINSRNKHIDIRYHYVREAVAKRHINIQYCPTSDQLADMLTKAVPKAQIESQRRKIGLINFKF